MRGPFRYISDERLATMSSTEPWWRRLRPTFRVGPSQAQVETTIAANEATRATRVEGLERALRKQRRVRSPQEALQGKPGMFEFEGPAAFASAEGAFWTATVSDQCAVLLVGSLKHAIGATPPKVEVYVGISPSVHPGPAVHELLRGRLAKGPEALNFVAAWQDIIQTEQIAPFVDLPPVRGIAEYRTRVRGQGLLVLPEPEGSPIRQPDNGQPMNGLLVGAPLWIEAA